jgi:demethylmenaquinone methyltransferase / 2-methoxy-6-polyprenyl-1,4-benzoquinol methylase
MGNEFYQAGEERAARVQQLFSRIAPRYDLINDLQSFGLHRRWKKVVVRMARPKPEERVLDLCCGTGDLALRLSKCGPWVTGLDFNDRMLAVAKDRNEQDRPGVARHTVQFVQADAMRLPFPDSSFDVVTVAYGLRNLADVKWGLAEMRRVGRPGARLLSLDFGKPDNAVWRTMYFAYLKLFVPLLGRALCGSSSAYAYILESLKHYPGQRGVAEQMTELGLVNVRMVNLLGGVMSINYGENKGVK